MLRVTKKTDNGVQSDYRSFLIAGMESPSCRRERICSILATAASLGKRRVRFSSACSNGSIPSSV